MSVIGEHEYRGIQIGISWKALDGQRGYLYLDYNNSLSSSSSLVTYWLSPRSREWKNINRRAALEVLAIDTERLNQKGRDAGPGEILRYDTGPAKIELGSGVCKIGIWTMTYIRNEEKLIAVSISALKSRLVASAVVSGSTVDEQVSDALLDRLMTVPNIVEALQDKVKVAKGKEAPQAKIQGSQKSEKGKAVQAGTVDSSADKSARLAKAVEHLKLLWQRMKTVSSLSDADFPREMTIMLSEMTAAQRDSFFILTGVFIEEVIMELMRGLVNDAAAFGKDPVAAKSALSVGEFVRIWDTLQEGNASPDVRKAAKECFDALSSGLTTVQDRVEIKEVLAELQSEIDERYPAARAMVNGKSKGKGKGKQAMSKAGQNAMEDAMDWLRTLWTRANNDLAIQEHEVGTFLEVCIQTLPEEIKVAFDKLNIDKAALAAAMRSEIQEARPLARDTGVPSDTLDLTRTPKPGKPSKAMLHAVSDLRSIVTASLRQGGFSKLEVPALIQSAIKTMPPSTKEYYENLGVNMNDAATLYWLEYQREHSANGESAGTKGITASKKSNAQGKGKHDNRSATTSALVEGMMEAARGSMSIGATPAAPAASSGAKNKQEVQRPAPAGPLPDTPSTTVPTNLCVVCYDQARFECSRCHAKYCSETCQRDDWAHHKPLCKKV
ncbi:hypothetical protein BCR37DRAFT_380025 [Protomyces lactucae-debilis]|uniref:MYND-type domain-containing protein n=1 Tax=Protomyces lactucae-debilis TaxID=2754530 RepID=A0A1Y2FDU5_PROLT|nr:uncharacterized protein BCR37DRAFT_380025 [Protomyces lactucae-debilis]ORY82091.1 hypothetical protein BCR37DRAFT_380025 [Protomyces lactucae-debilis]